MGKTGAGRVWHTGPAVLSGIPGSLVIPAEGRAALDSLVPSLKIPLCRGAQKPRKGAQKPRGGAQKPRGGAQKPRGGALKLRGGALKLRGGAQKLRRVALKLRRVEESRPRELAGHV
jgi:hypothetical protein